ncbi:hypothetical protein DITRI_Ditri18aG0062100 [Diplodiscus trichospermus]
MSVSIEALAMAGVDYVEWGMDIEEWERDDELSPPHLLADEKEAEEEFVKGHLKQGCSIQNLEDNRFSETSVTQLCSPEVVHRRSTIEKIRFYFMPIEKMVLTMIKLLMISWTERTKKIGQ